MPDAAAANLTVSLAPLCGALDNNCHTPGAHTHTIKLYSSSLAIVKQSACAAKQSGKEL